MTLSDLVVYKICSRDAWQAALAEGTYRGSADDMRDGYIHFSTQAQLGTTLTKHFAGQSDLVLVACDAGSLGSALRWEPSRGGALFPHLYAPLDVAAARRTWHLVAGADGTCVLPEDLR